MGDAYERMFLNAARGDQALFVSAAELVEAWRIFTPLLHQIDEQRPQPVTHPFGMLPAGYIEWARLRGIEIHPTWHEYVICLGDKLDDITKVFAELDKDNSGKLAQLTHLLTYSPPHLLTNYLLICRQAQVRGGHPARQSLLRRPSANRGAHPFDLPPV